jgi:ribonuclease E
MASNKHQREVENRLQNALKQDRARVQLGRISRFGLMEMSRQRLRPSLGESSQIICPRCDGHGRMRSVESLSLSILRLAEENAMKESTGQVLVQAPPQIANYLLNEKRRALLEIEQRHEAPIIIVADDQLETPHFNVTRLREGDLGEETAKPSYHRTTPRKLETHSLTKAQLNIPAAPAVTHVKPAQPAPVREAREEEPSTPPPVFTTPAASKPGFFARMKALLIGEPAPATPAPIERNDRNDRGERGGSRNSNDGRRRDSRDGRENRGGQNRDAGREPRGNRPPQGAGRGPQPPSQQQKPQTAAPRPERSEEQKRLDEARKLEQQQRREEQQRKDLERREAQRQENIKREAERRAAREAAHAANPGAPVVVTVDPERLAAGEVTAVLPEGAMVASDAAPANAEATTAEGGRRRRGRRGGRRRRRQEGAAASDPNALNAESQSELDFDEEEPGEEQAVASENAENLGTPLPFKAPTLASTIPVTSAESEFDDLDGDEPAGSTDATYPVAEIKQDAEIEPARVLVSETILPPPAHVPPAPVVTMSTPAIATIIAAAPTTEPDAMAAPATANESRAVNESMWTQPAPEIRVTVNAPTLPPAFTAPAPAAVGTPIEDAALPVPTVIAALSETSPDAAAKSSEDTPDNSV